MGLAAGQAVAAKSRTPSKAAECYDGLCRRAFTKWIIRDFSKGAEIDWDKVIAFHMDEYVGLPGFAPAFP